MIWRAASPLGTQLAQISDIVRDAAAALSRQHGLTLAPLLQDD